MNAGRGRQRAYSDLLTGLIDLGPTTASDRFDELLEKARTEGRIDDDTARVLRWWQREAVRAQGDHLLTTAPALLAALDEAQADAIDSAASAESAWTTAESTPPAPASEPQNGWTYSAVPPTAAPPAATASPAAAAPAAPPVFAPGPLAPPAPGAAQPRPSGARHAAPPPPPETIQPVASGSGIPGLDVNADTPLFDQVAAVREPAPASDQQPTMPPSAAAAAVQPPAPDPQALVPPIAPIDEDVPGVPKSDWPVPRVLNLAAPARRRRLLVAGLTVIDDGNTLPSIADPP